MVIRNFADVKVHIRTVDILRAKVVYRLTFPSGKTYIGMTVQPLETRLRAHCNSAFNPNDRIFDVPKSRAIRKYLTFSVDILYQGDNLAEQEIAFIKKFESFGAKGYNATSGGEGSPGTVVSDKTRDKMSRVHRALHLKNPSIRKNASRFNKEKLSTPITQYTDKGEYITDFDSLTEASNKLGLSIGNISEVCNGNRLTTGGFTFRYKNPKVNGDIKIEKRKAWNARAVLQFTKEGKLIKEFDSAKEAELETNIKGIGAVCLGNRKTAGGFIWKYKEINKITI